MHMNNVSLRIKKKNSFQTFEQLIIPFLDLSSANFLKNPSPLLPLINLLFRTKKKNNGISPKETKTYRVAIRLSRFGR